MTLRSERDGRFLARIIDRDGIAFVLDYGDPETIADASRRVLTGGFRVRWRGRELEVPPQHPEMVPLLASWYAERGYLVFLEEPTWGRRAWSLEDELPGLDDETAELDDQTEIRSRRDMARLVVQMQAQRGGGPPPLEAGGLLDLGDEDEPTELAPHPIGQELPDDEPTERVDGECDDGVR